MKRRLLATMLLAGAALATAGCASLLSSSQAPAQEFLLEADPGPAQAGAPGALTLLVDAPSAAAAYRTTDLLYRDSGPRLRRYRDSRWSAPPAQLAAEALAADLAASGLFRAVLPSPGPAQADLRLELRLLRLEQVFVDDDASTSRLVVALQATLTSPPRGLLLASRRFRVSEPAPGNAAGAAAAANRALTRLARDLRAFLAPHASASPRS